MGGTKLLEQIAENTNAIAGMRLYIIFTILIGLIMLVILLAGVCGIFDYVRKGHTIDEVRFDLRDVVDETIQERIRQLTIEHAEFDRYRQWVTELTEEKLDVEALGAETANRVKVLAIKMAEEEVGRALAERADIDREMSKTMKMLDENTGNTELLKDLNKKKEALNEHYECVADRIKNAERRLGDLTNKNP